MAAAAAADTATEAGVADGGDEATAMLLCVSCNEDVTVVMQSIKVRYVYVRTTGVLI